MWSLASAVILLFMGLGMVTAFVYQAVNPICLSRGGTPEDYGIVFEDVWLTSSDHIRLSGWWVPARQARATMILCHGYPADRTDVGEMIPFLHQAGYNVLAFDFRRLGKSEGEHSTIGLEEIQDLDGAVTYAQSRSKAPIGVLGYSMGASVALMQAGRDPRIQAVIADSPYASLDRMCARRWAFLPKPLQNAAGAYTLWLGNRLAGRPLREASPLQSAARWDGRPLLLIHGTQDRLIPYSDSVEIANAAPGTAELWLAPGSSHIHAFRDHRHEFERRVLVFLERNLTQK